MVAVSAWVLFKHILRINCLSCYARISHLSEWGFQSGFHIIMHFECHHVCPFLTNTVSDSIFIFHQTRKTIVFVFGKMLFEYLQKYFRIFKLFKVALDCADSIYSALYHSLWLLYYCGLSHFTTIWPDSILWIAPCILS